MDYTLSDDAFWNETGDHPDQLSEEDEQNEYEPDNCADDLSDDEGDTCEPFPLTNTHTLKESLAGQDIVAKVKLVLVHMQQQGINLPLFLDALGWGDSGCRADPMVQYARTALTISDKLPGILQ